MALRLSGLDPRVRPNVEWLLDYARRYQVPVTVSSTRRSRAEQQRLYDRFKAGRSRWPAAPPGTSAHEYGMAWDSVVPYRYQRWWNQLRRWAGWTVPTNDEIHAQVPNWRELV